MKLFVGPCASCFELRRRVKIENVPNLSVYSLTPEDVDAWAEADMLDVHSTPTLVLDDGRHVCGVDNIARALSER